MTEFVTTQNGQYRDAVPGASQEKRQSRGCKLPRACRVQEIQIVKFADEHRGQNGCDEQNDVQPHTIAKLLRRMPDVLRRTTDELKWRRNSLGISTNGFQPIDYPMFWRSFPGLKRIVRPGGIRTSFPVRGLRPMPRLRGLTWKTPNPLSSIRSPRCIEVRIASNTASTATSALTLVISAVFETSLTMSTLIMLMVSSQLVNTINTRTYAVKAEAKLTLS